jgi:AraC-like DNA-binding protein
MQLPLQTQTIGTTGHPSRRRLPHASFIGRISVKTTAGLTEQLPSVTQTAADLRYDNPAAFSTLFKRILGMTPREYIQSIDRSWEGSSRPPIESGL